MRVAIDAGHGSQTAGKRTVDGYREHWINVKTAYYCEQYLQKNGIETLRVAWNDTISTDDKDVSLSERQKIIKNAKCDLSVSCHANAHGDGKNWTTAQGVDTFYHSNSAYRGDSVELAKKVQSRLIEGTKQTNRGYKSQSLAMCNCPAMGTKASILCEIGFMTNKAEADLMKTDTFCKEQGEDIARGILDYIGIKEVTAKTEFKVKLLEDLNIRSTPNGNIVAVNGAKKGNVYTIVQTSGTWGKLKSGVGWISISEKYVKRV